MSTKELRDLIEAIKDVIREATFADDEAELEAAARAAILHLVDAGIIATD